MGKFFRQAKAAINALRDPKSKTENILFSLSGWFTVASVVSVPLFFLPGLSQPLELAKQAALLVLVSLAAMSLIGIMVIRRSFFFRTAGVANYAVLALVAVTAISSFVSPSRHLGLVGESNEQYQSLFTTVLFAVLFYVIVNLPERFLPVRRVVFSFVVSGGLASVLAIMNYVGINVPFLPNAPGFNLVGSTVILGLVAAVVVSAGSTYFLMEEEGRFVLLRRIVVALGTVAAFSVVAAVNYWPVWAVMAFGTLVVPLGLLVRPRNLAKRVFYLAVPMAALTLALTFFVFNFNPPIAAPIEVFPSLGASLETAKRSLAGSELFGDGPGTYSQAFMLYRDAALNQSLFWYVQFNRGISYLLTATVTLGLAGLAAWLGLIVIGAWKSVSFLLAVRRGDKRPWALGAALAAVWLCSAAGLAVFGASLASLLVFWVFFALLIRSTLPPLEETRAAASPRARLALVFVCVAVSVFTLAGWFSVGTRLYADAALARSTSRNVITEVDLIVADLKAAAKAEPRSAVIARNLSRAYLYKLAGIASDKSLNASDRSEDLREFSSAAIDSALLATEISPDDAANWSQLGNVYETLIVYAQNADKEAINAYGKASELDPTSPIYPTARARVYLSMVASGPEGLDSARDVGSKEDPNAPVTDSLTAAETELNHALELKPNFDAASYQLALLRGMQGRTKEAISELQTLKQTNPDDAGVVFRLALFFYADGNKDAALPELERAIALAPKYSDARWLIAMIYDEKGELDKAISQIEEILTYEPDNKTVSDKLRELKDKKAAATAVTDSTEN